MKSCLSLVAFAVVSLLLGTKSTFESGNDTTREQSANIMRETFNDERCIEPCWQQIEVGHTDEQTAVDILQELQLKYRVVDIPGNEIRIFIVSVDPSSPLWRNAEAQRCSLTTFDDAVVRIECNLDVCISSVLETYGIPLVSPGLTELRLLYPDSGLEFLVSNRTERVWQVVLRTKEFSQQLIEEMPDVTEWENVKDAFSSDCEDSLSGR